MNNISGSMWITDTRKSDSPFRTAFVHYSQLPVGIDPLNLPNREQIFAFQLVDGEKGIQAIEIEEVGHYFS